MKRRFSKIRSASLASLLIGLAGLLSACGESANTGASLVPPDKPCVVVEGPKGLINQDKPAPLVVDQAKSPEYCKSRMVIDDFQAALSWYKNQTKNNTYGPAMLQEMENYYAGEVLQETRASTYYNQQAHRVVIGKWDQIVELTGPEWSPDGTRATLTARVGGYKLLTFEEGHIDGAQVDTSKFEVWVQTLAFDARSKHWKIIQAESRFENPL